MKSYQTNNSFEIPYLHSFFDNPYNPLQDFHDSHPRKTLIGGFFNWKGSMSDSARMRRVFIEQREAVSDEKFCRYANFSNPVSNERHGRGQNDWDYVISS